MNEPAVIIVNGGRFERVRRQERARVLAEVVAWHRVQERNQQSHVAHRASGDYFDALLTAQHPDGDGVRNKSALYNKAVDRAFVVDDIVSLANDVLAILDVPGAKIIDVKVVDLAKLINKAQAIRGFYAVEARRGRE